MNNALPLLPIPRNHQDRRLDLEDFAARLNPYDWRMLSEILHKRDFRLDIIGKLPLELVIQIISYLDPVTPFRYQCVSRTWCDKLSSAEVLDASLAQWFGKPRPLKSGDTVEQQQNDDDRTLQYMKLEHMQRFRTAQPSSSVTLPIPDLDVCTEVSLHGDWLGFIYRQHDDALYVVNLRTKDRFVTFGDAREQLFDVAITDRLAVSVSTTGRVYACELRGRERKILRLPNAKWVSFGAMGWTVAFLFRFDESYEVIVWDFRTMRTSTFEVEQKQYTWANDDGSENYTMVPESLRMSATSDSITVILRGSTRDAAFIGFIKFSYVGDERGACLHRRFVPKKPDYYKDRPGDSLSVLNHYFWKSQTFGEGDRYYLCSGATWSDTSEETYTWFYCNDEDLSISPRDLSPNFDEFVRWKEVLLRGTADNALVEHFRCDLVSVDADVSTRKTLHGSREDMVYTRSPYRANVSCNERWIVAYGDAQLHIWGFENGSSLDAMSKIWQEKHFKPIHHQDSKQLS